MWKIMRIIFDDGAFVIVKRVKNALILMENDNFELFQISPCNVRWQVLLRLPSMDSIRCDC